MRVLHVTTGLRRGGAERQLTDLVGVYRSSAVFSLEGYGEMADDVRSLGVPVYCGDVKRAYPLSWLLRLRSAVLDFQPQVVMGWMYHGNVAAVATRLLGFRGPALWNIRHSIADLRFEKPMTRLVIRVGAGMSRFPTHIVYNSVTAARQHEALGYDSAKTKLIANGFDTERFCPDPLARQHFRSALGVGQDGWLLGVVGRAHAIKNHRGWLKSFCCLARDRSDVYSVIVGRGVPDDLEAAVREHELQDRVFLLDGVTALEKLYPAFDLLVLPSWGEGFSNVVGEAMACGVPAVVTPVGDGARLVGKTGFVAKSPAPDDLYSAVKRVLSGGIEEVRALGERARQRIIANYSQRVMAEQYAALFEASLSSS